MIKFCVRAGVVSAVALCVVPVARATSLLYEPFSVNQAQPSTSGYPSPVYAKGQAYPDNTALVGLGPTSGNYWSFSGDTSAITTPPPDGQVSTSASTGNLADPTFGGGTSPGTDITYGGDGASERVDLATVSITPGNNEFYSFAFKINDLGALTTGSNILGGLNAAAGGNTAGNVTSFTSELLIQPGSDSSHYELGIAKSTADTPNYDTTDQLSVGTTYFLVAEYSIKASLASTASLYLFNSDGSQVDGGATAFGAQPGTADAGSSTAVAEPGTGIKNFALYQYANLNETTNHLLADDSVTVDDLRVGTTYANVVPEPASLSFLALAGLGLIRRRRA